MTVDERTRPVHDGRWFDDGAFAPVDGEPPRGASGRPGPGGGSGADERRRRTLLGLATVGVLVVAGVAAVVTAESPDESGSLASGEPAAAVSGADLAGSGPAVAQAAADFLEGAADDAEPFVEFVDTELSGVEDPDPEGAAGPERSDGGCTIGALSLQFGSSGEGVRCLQEALAETGFYTAAVTGEFGQQTFDAVKAFQVAEDKYVDGVVGRETAIGLNIWPDEESFVVRTPPPAPGAVDLWGVELSPVASAGDDAPPLPEGSGSGYRVVYDRAGQRAWAVDGNERIIRSWLVSGSTYSNELPGTHYVYSRSEVSTAWNGKAYLPLMIRWLKTEKGNIGFHGIPTKVDTGAAYQTTAELGTRLSGGCQRQHDMDAAFLWGFADVGTKVVVT